MGLSDEGKDSLGAQERDERDLGGGKDLLYGWLVGRAAADLGLAQALVASEAQTGEQIKRLEDNLWAQIRLLEKRQASTLGSENNRADLAAFKAELERFGERQNLLETERVSVEQLEATISTKLRQFESEMARQSEHRVGGELGELRTDLALLSQRLGRVESAPQAAAAFADEINRLNKDVNERVSARVDALINEIDAKILAIAQVRVDQDAYIAEAAAMAERMARLEQAALSSAVDLKAEIRGLHDQLNHLAGRVAELMKRADDHVRRETERQKEAQEFKAFVAERMHELTNRVAQLELVRQQAQSLSDGAADRSRQFVEALGAELAALQTKLAEREARDAQRDGSGRELNARIFDIQEQLREKMAWLDNRDGEIAELKLQVQDLMQLVAPKSTGQSAVVNRPHGPTGMIAGWSGLKARPETPPTLNPGPEAIEQNSLLQSYAAGAETSNDLKKQLQQRMSADIERARAELRKRAGMSR